MKGELKILTYLCYIHFWDMTLYLNSTKIYSGKNKFLEIKVVINIFSDLYKIWFLAYSLFHFYFCIFWGYIFMFIKTISRPALKKNEKKKSNLVCEVSQHLPNPFKQLTFHPSPQSLWQISRVRELRKSRNNKIDKSE